MSVSENDPRGLRKPHVPEALLSMDNVVLQPHRASATVAAHRLRTTRPWLDTTLLGWRPADLDRGFLPFLAVYLAILTLFVVFPQIVTAPVKWMR